MVNWPNYCSPTLVSEDIIRGGGYTGLYAEIFPRGGKFGVRTKEGGGGSLCEVLHPTLAGGGGGG